MSTGEILALFIGAIIVLLGIGVLRYTTAMLKAVVESASKSSDIGGLYVGLTATMIALFGILISGVFLFMTLQINNSASQAATSAATREARRIAEDIAPTVAQNVAEGIAQAVAENVAQAVAEQEARQETRIVLSSMIEEHLKDSGILRDAQEEPSQLEIDQPLVVSLEMDGLERFELGLQAQWSRYQIDAVGGSDDANGQFDTVLSLYDGTDVLLEYNDDIQDTLNSQIVFDAEMSESYYVELYEYWGSAGEATLTLSPIRSSP